jgi:hypothetical protein
MSPADPHGQNSGQPDWGTLLDALVAEHGSLATLAQRLVEGGVDQDVTSAERGLRRLRGRGPSPGGVWGERLLRTFGLPAEITERLRFMGSYHSRFEDLPVPLAADLVALWDRPPQRESRAGRVWLALAGAHLALRRRDPESARRSLERARSADSPDLRARVEGALGLALLESQAAPGVAPPSLARVPDCLAQLEGDDADCLRARYVGQLAWTAFRAGDLDGAERLFRGLPARADTHPFAASRRANGLAYSLHRRGLASEALHFAQEAVRTAGDGGHVRLRAMGLLMVARVSPDERERAEARQRALRIGLALEDAVLVHRAGGRIE